MLVVNGQCSEMVIASTSIVKRDTASQLIEAVQGSLWCPLCKSKSYIDELSQT